MLFDFPVTYYMDVVEAGYPDWSGSSRETTTLSTNVEAALDAMRSMQPISSDGFYVGPQFSYRTNRKVELYAKTGMWTRLGEYNVIVGDTHKSMGRDGNDLLFSFGVAVPISVNVKLGAMLQQMELQGNDQTFLGLSIQYK